MSSESEYQLVLQVSGCEPRLGNRWKGPWFCLRWLRGCGAFLLACNGSIPGHFFCGTEQWSKLRKDLLREDFPVQGGVRPVEPAARDRGRDRQQERAAGHDSGTRRRRSMRRNGREQAGPGARALARRRDRVHLPGRRERHEPRGAHPQTPCGGCGRGLRAGRADQYRRSSDAFGSIVPNGIPALAAAGQRMFVQAVFAGSWGFRPFHRMKAVGRRQKGRLILWIISTNTSATGC